MVVPADVTCSATYIRSDTAPLADGTALPVTLGGDSGSLISQYRNAGHKTDRDVDPTSRPRDLRR